MKKNKTKFTVLLAVGFALAVFSQIDLVSAEVNTIVVPDDFSTIQEAVDVAADGDTVFVKSGTYNESVSIDCSISLIGENPKTTTIIGDWRLNGTIVLIRKNNVTLTGFTVKPSAYSSSRKGVHLLHVSYCNVYGNIFLNNGDGVWLYGSPCNNITGNTINGMDTRSNGIKIVYSPNNLIADNFVIQNDDGIKIQESNNITIFRNTILNNDDTGLLLISSNSNISENVIENQKLGLRLSGKNNFFRANKINNSTKNFDLYWSPSWTSKDFVNYIDDSNTFDGIPITYWVNRSDEKVPESAHVVVLVNCNNITVENLNLSKSKQGIIIVATTNTTVINNKIKSSSTGIQLFNSSKNTIICNHLFNVPKSIHLFSSVDNSIRGNFIIEGGRAISLESSSDNNVISNNSISAGSYRGITLDASHNNELFFNLISDCRQGGVWIWNRASQNLIYLNNFANNTEHVEKYITNMQTFPKNIWDNGTIGNYWDNYSSSDWNENGIGDTSYTITQNNKDNYPLIKEIDIEIIPEFPSFLYLLLLIIAISVIFFKRKLINVN